MAINRGLGKGLSALFSDTDAEYENSSSKNKPHTENSSLNVSVEDIYANPYQPRKTFSAQSISELSLSIKEHGILQPIIVCKKNEKYMIIAGERRFKAALEAGLSKVPVIVKDFSEQKIMEVSLIENLQREDLNAIEAAYAIKMLIDKYSLTQEELSQRIGKSRSSIANLLRLLTLPSEVLNFVKQNVISEGHARCLIGLEKEKAIYLAKMTVEKKLSVRELEKLVKSTSMPKVKKGMPP
ncbi:MAG: ParB/RepB/Spo0J family partition protein, partial [Clostridia bacterium]|nr:ParB/RepB/Spo0J family partition protein [Clostridia bacterium]